eukprot:gene11722-5061_t
MSAICYACTEKKKGCQWSGTFSELLKHEKLCDYVEIDCEYEGCEYKCIRKEMVKHEEKCVPILQFKLSERNEEYINLQNKYENLKIKSQQFTEGFQRGIN